MPRNNFTWFAKLTDVCNSLPAECQAEMMLAIINYGTYGVEPNFSNALLLPTFVSVRDDIDNSINARTKNKGGRPAKEITKANHEQNALAINSENGGFEVENGGFEVENGGFEVENGGFEVENGGFEVENPSYINHTIPYHTKPNYTNTEREGKRSGKRFAPPTEDEAGKCATEYMRSKGVTVAFDKSRFVNFYAARNWRGISNWESLVKAWVDTSIEEDKQVDETGKPRGKPRKCPNCGANVSKDTGTGKWVCDMCFEELA